jgi:hypothetical protein
MCLCLPNCMLRSSNILVERVAMVSRVITRLEDDLDGSEAVETIQFSVDGVEYEIDLSKSNADNLRDSFGDYIAHGRKVGGRRGRRSASPGQVDIKAVRAWANSNGIQLSQRGRIPADVISQYHAAGN